MAAQTKTRLTPEEYFILDEQAEYKSEYRDGEMVAMTSGTAPHSAIISNVLISLGGQIKGTSCRAFDSNLRVQAGTYYLYPDVTFVCGKPLFGGQNGETLLNATLLVEVLSKSTENFDRGEKFNRYKQIATLTDYLLIAQDRPHVEHYTRQSNGLWLLAEVNEREATLKIAALNCDLSMSDLYDRVTFVNSGGESEDV